MGGRRRGMFRGRVLVVSAEREGREAIASLLVGEGFDVSAFESDEEARAWASDLIERPCLAVIDLALPAMKGFDLACWLVDASPQTKVLLTAIAGPEAPRRQGM